MDSPPNNVSSSFLFDSSLLSYKFSVSFVISSLEDCYGTMKLYIFSLFLFADNFEELRGTLLAAEISAWN